MIRALVAACVLVLSASAFAENHEGTNAAEQLDAAAPTEAAAPADKKMEPKAAKEHGKKVEKKEKKKKH